MGLIKVQLASYLTLFVCGHDGFTGHIAFDSQERPTMSLL